MMYESFFELSQEPFSVAPDPKFIYLSPEHREAVNHLMYGLQRAACFILLTGEVGAGKTTVWRAFLKQLPPNVDVAYVVNPKLDARSLLTRVCEDLRIELPSGTVDLIDALHGHLLLAHSQGRRTLIVVDEAQALSFDVLEQLRLLTNLDATGGMLQVLLIGQPELRTMLQHPTMQPVAQRVVSQFHLCALSAEETKHYVAHRLSVAGRTGEGPFDDEALRLVHKLCAGVPRRINVLCDRAMQLACSAGRRHIGEEQVQRAAADVFVPSEAAPPPVPIAADSPKQWPRLPVLIGVGAAALAVGLALGFGHGQRSALPEAYQRAIVEINARDARQSLANAIAAGTQTPPPASAPSAAPALPTGTPAPVTSAESSVRPPPTAAPAGTNTTANSTIEALPADADDGTGVWSELARHWDKRLPAGVPCVVASRVGLQCFRSTGGLEPIRQLDRPGIVTLHDASGRAHAVVLTGLTSDKALLSRHALIAAVPLGDLVRLWSGDFATLWRTPPGYAAGGGAAAATALEPWLSAHLPPGGDNGTAGGSRLSARLRAFQLVQGLKPDGVPGPMTLMKLSHAAGLDEPQLQAP